MWKNTFYRHNISLIQQLIKATLKSIKYCQAYLKRALNLLSFDSIDLCHRNSHRLSIACLHYFSQSISSSNQNQLQSIIKMQQASQDVFQKLKPVGISFVAVLLTLALFYGQNSAQVQLVFQDSPFGFHVYCPITNHSQLQKLNSSFGNLTVSPDQVDVYAVYVKAKNVITVEDNESFVLTYCGLARTWLGTCQNATIICSSPGPMFYLPVKRPIYIIWVNSVDPTTVEWPEVGCFNPNSSNSMCTVKAKLPSAKQSESCTFQDSSYLRYRHTQMRINKNDFSISTHIHGLSNRPVFDGNPLSWFTNSGQKGVAFISLSDYKYFQEFENFDQYFDKLGLAKGKNVKIDKHQNNQPPGTLVYHDHAMKSTRFNINYGLTGLYILHDPEVQALLPSGKYQKFIVFTAQIEDDLRNNSIKTQRSVHHGSNSYTQTVYILNPSDIIQRGRTYRFRIINNHFDNIYRHVSFAIFYANQSNQSNQSVLEISPHDPTYNLTENAGLIPFTLIGADTTLFRQPIENMTEIDMGTLQRVQILIRFDQANGVPLEITHFYLVCFDTNAQQTVLKFAFQIQNTNNATTAENSNLSITNLRMSYTNLSEICQEQIVVKRMKPLFSRPSDQKFIINGHYMYGQGASDLPKIGTIEDWYFINTISEAHPMHTHLVNFQVVNKFTLKRTDQGCTLYELDFYRLAGYPPIQNMSNAQLCYYLNGNITQAEADQLYHYLSNHYLQNITRFDPQVGRMTGFNVLQQISSTNEQAVYNSNQTLNCSFSNFSKYLCDDISQSIPEHYRRWKDTALLQGSTVTVLRIRWAKTEYDPYVQKYPYFDIPEEHLMEFPGFLYHCHILPHQDNEMMRPFMLQASDAYLKIVSNQNKVQSEGKGYTQWPLKAAQINYDNRCK